jgi:hypothetical protein
MRKSWIAENDIPSSGFFWLDKTVGWLLPDALTCRQG